VAILIQYSSNLPQEFPRKEKKDCYVVRSPESEANATYPPPEPLKRLGRKPAGREKRKKERALATAALHSLNGNINGLKKGEEQSAQFRGMFQKKYPEDFEKRSS